MDMKAIIWIIIVLLLGWGLWYFLRDDVGTDTTTGAPIEQVQANDDINLGDFDVKG
jgi:hypothetical protein